MRDETARQTNKRLVTGKPPVAFSMETVFSIPVISSLLIYLSSFVVKEVEI